MNSYSSSTETTNIGFNPSESAILNEANRLYKKLQNVGFDLDVCKDIAPITLEINFLKKKNDVTILAHSYQTPDIIYGIADYKGDSYYLSKVCQEISSKNILFCGVKFMAETAKILNPHKTVYLPDIEAGCSLADSITGIDVKELKKKYPNKQVVTYINTSADVKAESDVIVTSANVTRIIDTISEEEIIFLPDKYMAENIAERFPTKKFISWHGKCIVHEEFTGESVDFYRKQFGEDLHILVHTECAPEVVHQANMAGGTGDMIRYIKNHPEAKKLMLVTECGLSERLKVEFPDREFIGSCVMCPYMKRITLDNVLACLRNPSSEQEVILPNNIIQQAEKSLRQMILLTENNNR